MKTEKHGYESPNVEKVVANVRAGIRSKADLEYCGCPICKAALRVLEDSHNDFHRTGGGGERQ